MKYALLILFLLNSTFLYAETVEVNILTKSIRKIAQEGGSITLSPINGRIIDAKSGEAVGVRVLRLTRQRIWRLEAVRPLEEGEFRIEGTDLLIEENGDKRIYPLPAKISLVEGKPQITVKEDADRYAVDAASAELGPVADSEREALAALAMVIKARCRMNGGKVLGDLAYNQIYRGRILSDRFSIKNDGWEIDTAKLPGELLFHAESGGRTFDQSVFSGKKGGFPGVDDSIPFLGIRFGEKDRWQRRLSFEDISSIFKIQIKIGGDFRELLKAQYKEGFRLAVNRVKGWNFIKSNNYSWKADANGIEFDGTGIGHGCGLSQRGALQLSRLGFSRFEILQHYYKGISFRNTGAKLSYNLSYAIFDLASGNSLYSSNPALAERFIPPGSFTKILSSLAYMSAPEGFGDGVYTCTGRDRATTVECWNPRGHGVVHLDAALYNSCNAFFASATRKIPYSSYVSRCQEIQKQIGMSEFLPETADAARYARLSCGLDFGVKVTVRDIMKLISYISGFSGNGLDAERQYIRDALGKTFTAGTGKEPERTSGEAANDAYPKASNTGAIYGKTSTVIYGTNASVRYGMFAGWRGGRGIVVILRGGTGQLAAQWGEYLLD